MKKVTIEVPDGKKAEWINGVLTLVDEKDSRPVTERIKTVEDALRELGTPEEEIEDFFKKFESMGKDVVAYMKLRVIAEALNEGWKPQFIKGEYRYYPWFDFYTEDELNEMSEEDKKECRVVARSGSNANANSGVAYSNTNNAFTNSNTAHGGRLCFKTSGLAEYAGKQFLDIWADFVMPL